MYAGWNIPLQRFTNVSVARKRRGLRGSLELGQSAELKEIDAVALGPTHRMVVFYLQPVCLADGPLTQHHPGLITDSRLDLA